MEKLIELLNEYELEREKGIKEFKNWDLPLWEWSIDDGDLVYDGVEPSMNLESAYGDTANGIVISKSYGFIKWLVDNDKIDHKIYEDMKFTAIKQGVLVDKKSGSTAQETREIIKNGCIDTFIALLAISDTPIQDLCVWLK